jgi:O-methyltransferase
MLKSIAKKALPRRVVRALKTLAGSDGGSDIPATYDQDGLRTMHNCDFLHESRFIEAYEAGARLDSWFGGKVHWRVHTLFWAAERAIKLGGDFVECGVHRGGFSRAIVEYIQFEKYPDRKFYLLDSFEGMAPDDLSEEEVANGLLDYPYSADYDLVKQAFGDYPNVVIERGYIPESLQGVDSDAISFLSVDLNNSAPEIAALEFFWNKLVAGAAVVLDDYGWEKHIVQKRAFDDFANRKAVPILSLPTGQGLIIKP